MQNNPASPGDTEGLTSEQLLLVTKLARPRVRADLVPRPRLVNQLQLGIQRTLMLIAAPAGFGKTTLLSLWLEHASFPSAWLSLEGDDDDLIRFWSYVFTALSRIYPGSEISALALLQASHLSPISPIETVLSVWINDLATLPHDVALVLDDYHLITMQSIHRSVTYLIEHLPHHLHLIIATRADPSLPLARLRMRGSLTEIRAADLRFTAEEIAAFLARIHGLSLEIKDIAALEARTEGWIAGLQLAALSMQGHKDIPGFLNAFTGSHRYIIDYLTEEVLARQPEPVQTFLLQTAILERLQGSLCEAVIGEYGGGTRGQAMLEQLEQANLFLVPLDDERRWYRYHQLFAEALRHRLQSKDSTLVLELHRRASSWYEQQGMTHEAVHHALVATDFAQAARLIEQAFNSLVRRGEIATLQRWADALPGELVRSNIELSILQGWLLFVSGKHDAAELYLQDIERTFGITPVSDEPREQETMPNGTSSQAEIKGRIAAIRASIAVTRGDLPRTIALSRLALEYLPKENISRAYAAWYLGRAYWLRGDVRAASIALAEASHVSWEVDHLYTVFMVTHDLAHVQKLQGHLHQADQTYRQALQQALERGGDLPAIGPAYVGRGNLEYEWNHLDAATSLLQEGIKLCERTGNRRAILQAYVTLAFIKQAQGDKVGASAIMQQMVQITEQQHPSQHRNAQVEAFWAWLSLMQGDESAVLRWLQRCGLSLDQEVSHLREREYLTLVRVLITQRRLNEAKQWLENLLQLAEAQGRTGSVIEILMLQAEALQAYGDMNQAIKSLSRAFSLAEPEGYTRLFVDEGAPIAHLLVQMRRHPPGGQPGSTHYRENLLALLGRAYDEDVSHSAVAVPGSGTYPLIEPLSERELEVLRLIVAGCSNREIADRLVIAVSTVKWYVNAIYGKLQVESRTKAIARARELNIV
ncbi:MAG TPA: LuxR C-terminal-related transcriptional regulator [Ktedonobacteraceae bacterium]|nr:LuxR C-terminal-related transcriptional regulator [Ktedonobacteraceae bacterium]